MERYVNPSFVCAEIELFIGTLAYCISPNVLLEDVMVIQFRKLFLRWKSGICFCFLFLRFCEGLRLFGGEAATP